MGNLVENLGILGKCGKFIGNLGNYVGNVGNYVGNVGTFVGKIQEFRQGCWKLTHDRKVLFSRRNEFSVGNEDQRLIAEHSLLIRFSSFSI